jgi:LPS export ABC transporter protein LptC
MPAMTVKNIRVTQSERGMITLELTAPLLRTYEGKDPYTEFPQGVHIIFFDSVMQPKSELTAGFGISYDSRNLMEARNDVVIRNFKKKEQLNTEKLTWDKNKRKVFTDEFVKITQIDKIVQGKGMESDEVFDNWVIRNVTGTIYVKDKK